MTAAKILTLFDRSRMKSNSTGFPESYRGKFRAALNVRGSASAFGGLNSRIRRKSGAYKMGGSNRNKFWTDYY
jgi:hypothetical protein